MHVLPIFVAFLGCGIVPCNAWGLHTDNATHSRRFIIEIDQGDDLTELRVEIESRPGNRVLRTFNNRVFRGLSVESSAENVDSLRGVVSVINVWLSRNVELAPVLNSKHFADDATASNYSIHHMTGVDRLHQEGVYGQGVTVAVIDTGIAYNHSALGEGFGPGFKVAGGYDLVGDNWLPSGSSEKQPDDDPFDPHGHGTHVAGIIAGETENWVGVAPEATLLAYKVFGIGGGTDEDTLIEAFLMAHEDGADIITASIGGPGGWSSDAWAVIASRIVEDGTLVTISAGNSGGAGPFFGSSGSSGKFVLAVASVDVDTLPALPFEATTTLGNISDTSTFGYIPADSPFPTEVKNYPVWLLSLNISDMNAGCQRLPSRRNLSDVVILAPLEGGCSPTTRVEHLVEMGARYVLFYNDTELAVPRIFSGPRLQFGAISFDTVVTLAEYLLEGADVMLDFSVGDLTRYVGIQNAAGGVASYFTSLAALYDLQIKPDIAAPGGNIFSSYLNNTFQVMSGTSMACPYVAGVAALYIGKHGGRARHGRGFARDLAMRIRSSGRAVRWSNGATSQDYGQWAPVFQVGTGLIDAYAVLTYNTTLSWTKLELNDTDYHERHHKIAITNNGSRRARYRFSVQPAGGLEALDTASDPPLVQLGPDPMPPIIFEPTVLRPEVDLPREIWVEPGSTKAVEFLIDYPVGLHPNLPVYSGKILISSTNSEELSVPYLGVAASIRDTFQDPYYPRFPLATSTLRFINIKEKPYFSFNLSRFSQDYPQVDVAFRWGVRQLRWDIFEPGWNESRWKYPPEIGIDGYVGSATSFARAGFMWWFDPDYHDEDDIITFPLQDLSRSLVYSYWWLGRMADGTMIAPGNYTMRFAALRPFGNPHDSDDWALFDVPEIEITRLPED